MTDKSVFSIGIILTLLLGLFLIIYGLYGGIIQKKILVDGWKKEYVTGRGAVIRGCFYIVIGLLFWAISVGAVMRALEYGFY